MKKMFLFALMVFVSASLTACERKTTTVIKEVAPPTESPAVKIKINDGSGSGVDVNIPTK